MKNLNIFQSISFWQILCFAVLVLVNTANFIEQFWKACFDCDTGFGFPFRVYASENFASPARVVWTGLAANVLSSVVVGLFISLELRQFRTNKFN